MSGSIKLLLLFGMPRSGTTWFGKVFDSHTEVIYKHEPDSMKRMDNIIPLFPDISRQSEYELDVNQYVVQMLRLNSVRISGKFPIFRKQGQSEFSYQTQKTHILARKTLDRLLKQESVWKYGVNNHKNPTYVWKSIESTGRMGVLLGCIPNSKGILIVRHPCGYIASVIRGQRKGKFIEKSKSEADWGYYELLSNSPLAEEYQLGMESFRNMRPEERLAWRWALVNEKAYKDILNLENGMAVRYEDLCENPLDEYKKLFRFSGLSWDRQSEEFLNSSILGNSSNYYSVFKNPMHSASKWKQELEKSEVDRILAIIQKTDIGNWYFSGTEGKQNSSSQ